MNKHDREYVEKAMGRCRFFNGIQNSHCEAGVAYADVRGPSTGHGYGPLPCLKNWMSQGVTIDTCPVREWVSKEEAHKELQRSNEALTAFLRDLAEDRCPHCKTPIQAYEQVGRCVYAHPCGDRLYQGTVPVGKPRFNGNTTGNDALAEWNRLSEERS